MDRTVDPQSDWARTPVSLQDCQWRSRLLQRFGLQGKLVACFMMMMLVTLAASCWFSYAHNRALLSYTMGEQSLEVSHTLALAAVPSMQTRDTAALNLIGRDILRNCDAVAVTFFDNSGKVLAAQTRDARFAPAQLSPGSATFNPQPLMRVTHHTSSSVGPYVDVTAPIFQLVSDGAPPAKSLGYITLQISEAREQVRLQHIDAILVVVGAVSLLASLPLICTLVHRIFLPIRQLVAASNRIAAGDLDASVAIHRPDVIGTLARSFNEMALCVKQQRQELADANAGLEQKVLDRTAQLEIANKRLSAEIAEKEDFLRTVSHDLSAPLRNISGMASMLLLKSREKFDADVVHRLERIQKNVEIETDLIGELLELSRIKTRRQKMERVDLSEVVRELAGVFEQDLKSKSIALTLDTPLPPINGEKLRLRQVFQNLIDNAIKYMGDGAAREIHIGCRPGVNDAEFYVRDTGLGIEPEDITRVFMVFRRGRNTACQNVAGKGVGLASVKSIIETYSGTICVQSTAGQGSEFRFTINQKFLAPAELEAMETREHPVAVQEMAMETNTIHLPEKSDADEASAGSAYAQPLTILLVDDDEDCRMLLRDAIAECKVSQSVYEVCNGLEALAFLRREGPFADAPRPALIYLDVEMPGMDGQATLAEIKSDPQLKDIPVVMMTGVSDEAQMQAAARAGANSYTLKPANAQLFLRTVMLSARYWLTVHQYPSHRLPQELCKR